MPVTVVRERLSSPIEGTMSNHRSLGAARVVIREPEPDHYTTTLCSPDGVEPARELARDENAPGPAAVLVATVRQPR